MHTTNIMKSEDYTFTIGEDRAVLEDIFPGFSDRDRIGIVVTNPCGAIGVSSLLMASITHYYDFHRSGLGNDYGRLRIYPEYFIFHIGKKHGDFRDMEIWPPHKEIVVEDDPEQILEQINDRGITRLLVEDIPQASAVFLRETISSAQQRIVSCIAYSTTGRVNHPDLTGKSNKRVEEFVIGAYGGVGPMSKVFVGSICLLAAAGMWGGMFVVSKYTLDYVSPFVLLWLRYLLAFLLLGVCCYFQKKQRIERRDFPLIVWLGLIGYCVSNASGFIGTHLSTASMGALVTSSSPAFVLLLAYFLLKEKLTWKKVISVAMATCGLFLVVGLEEGDGKGHLLGNLLLILGAITWALYIVNVKRIGNKYSPLTITTYTTGVALVLMTPAMLLDFRAQDLIHLKEFPILMGVLYLGIIATAAAFFLWNKGIELMEAGIGSIFYFFVPVIGGLFGWLFLGEVISRSFIAGGFLIFSGTLIIFLKKPPILSKNKVVIESKAGSISEK